MPVGAKKIAVLGSGVMGSSVALFLARNSHQIDLFEQAAKPFTGASRYNEGKIHLGYLYGADPTLKTAKKLIPGGLAFPRLLRELIDVNIDQFVTAKDDLYLIHRSSVADSQQSLQVATQVSALLSQHPESNEYFVPLKNAAAKPLAQSWLQNNCDTDHIVSGFSVPERSISTQPIADAFVNALNATSNISLYCNHRVIQVKSQTKEKWFIETAQADGSTSVHGPYDAVINALWEGREKVDQTLRLPPPSTCTHRYRMSLFAKTRVPVDVSSAVVAVGPFGDIKNYNGTDLYLSWYDTGLQAESEELVPPPTPELSPEQKTVIASDSIKHLGKLIPAVHELENSIETLEVRGGWVYAAGRGSLDRRDSQLHRRDRIGVRYSGSYISVDTGKYSIAPWLARKIADDLSG